MPKKRTSSGSSADEPANTGSDLIQEDENSKRAKLVSLSDTTLQDLPIELIERILIKVIVMEVQEMKLVKSERKGKANQVIRRLRTVSSKWDSILTTNFFRNELNRTFDAQKTIRLEIVHQSQPRSEISSLTTLKDELFVLYGPICGPSKNVVLDVLDCDNMAVVKDVIRLPEMYPLAIAADGSLIFTRKEKDKLAVISIYNADGSVKHQMRMYSDIPEFYRIIPRLNGNIVLVSTGWDRKTTLTEIDMDVTLIRQYQTSSDGAVSVCDTRMFGRMMLIDQRSTIEILDSELNFLDVTGRQLDKYVYHPETSHFNRDRNELIAIVYNTNNYQISLLTIFRFTEE